MKNGKEKSMFVREYLWRDLMTVCGLFVILLTIVIGAFLVYKGSSTFLVYRHSFLEFLGSADWAPEDNMAGGGSIGALIFIAGSLCTCGLALLIATPFSLGSAIFITEISPKFGEKFYRPVVEIFAGIPSVVYGWVGLTVLVPAIKTVFDRQVGHSILAAGLVLAVMIFPTITSVAADALHSVPKECRMAAYGLGSTRWQTIYRIVVPAAAPGIISGVILGLARAFGEALAVAMVIGQTTALPTSIFSTTKTLTTEIAAQMGNAMEGGDAIIENIPPQYREALLETGLASRPGVDMDAVMRILTILATLVVVSALLSYLQNFLMSGVAQRVSYRLRDQINRKMNKLPLSFYDKTTHGEVLSLITNDVDTVSTTLNQSLTQMITAVTTLVGVLVMMLSISGWMTLASLVALPFSFLVIRVVVKRSQKYFRAQQEYLGHVNGHIEEMYSGHNVVRLFNGEERSRQTFQELNSHLYSSGWRSQFLSGLMQPVLNFVSNIGYVIVCVLGGFLTIRGNITIGNILYPVCAPLQPARHPIRPDHEHPAVHRRGGGARVQLPGCGGGAGQRREDPAGRRRAGRRDL